MPRQSGLADREPCPWRIVDDVGGAFVSSPEVAAEDEDYWILL